MRVLLLPLGTPDAPDTASVRRYLREFLSDRRVIDLPRWWWLPLLHGVILRTRPAKSAALYRKIWTPEGSPLAAISRQQAQDLETLLQESGATDEGAPRLSVRVAMRYGSPSIVSALAECVRDEVDEIVALPMYPQYSGATTGSSVECLYALAARQSVVPPIRVVPPYFAHHGYIRAVADEIAPALAAIDAETLVLSFHGLPKRYCAGGDPYERHCQATGAAIRAALSSFRGDVLVTFQSRFGREEWLQPYTAPTLEALGARGARVVVACPGFTSDCLETLEEIAITGREQFMHAGGTHFRAVPCVNVGPAWIRTMAELVR